MTKENAAVVAAASFVQSIGGAMNNQIIPQSSLIVYRPANSKSAIQLPADLEHRTVWATQRQISEAFDISVQAVSRQIGNFKEQRGDAAKQHINKLLIPTNGGMQEVEHYDMTVITFVGYRAQATERTIAFQDYVGAELDRIIREQSTSLTPTQALLATVQHMVEIEAEQIRQADLIQRIEARQGAQDQDRYYWTIYEYALYASKHVDQNSAISLGKKATSHCKTFSIRIGKRKVAGRVVNTYPEDVLKSIFDNWYLQFTLLDEE